MRVLIFLMATGLILNSTGGEKMDDSVQVLKSSIAGSWYSADPAVLKTQLETYMTKVPDRDQKFHAVIVPHAGYVYSGQSAAYAYKGLRNGKYDRVVLLAPSHRIYLKDTLCIPEAGAVSTPLGGIPLDMDAIQQLQKAKNVKTSDSIHSLEHATQIQYPFIQCTLPAIRLIPVIVGELTPEGLDAAAETIRPLLTPDTLLLISSDFTHFGANFAFEPFRSDIPENVKKLDMGAFKFIQEKNLPGFLKYMENTEATICGQYPLALMLKLLPDTAKVELLNYSTSLERGGDETNFVCYLSAGVECDWKELQKTSAPAGNDTLTSDDKEKLLSIARQTIQHALEKGKALPQKHFSDEATDNMKKNMGVFVTLNSRSTGMLRGCIGEIEPVRPLYEAVTARAIDAAFRDPRFQPLTQREFEDVIIEISALTPSRPVKSWRDIVIGKQGMTLTKYGRSAVFLPQVAPEQGWTLEQTLTHLAMKAGLKPDDWKNGAEFTVFEAIVFHEKE